MDTKRPRVPTDCSFSLLEVSVLSDYLFTGILHNIEKHIHKEERQNIHVFFHREPFLFFFYLILFLNRSKGAAEAPLPNIQRQAFIMAATLDISCSFLSVRKLLKRSRPFQLTSFIRASLMFR